jgi:hypothetical protein
LQWPPFIPPTLKALRIDDQQLDRPYEPFGIERISVCALRGILAASDAELDRLEVLLPGEFDEIGDGLVHLAEALRGCSATLRGFLLSTEIFEPVDDSDACRARRQRMRAQWANVLAGVSACRELQVLVLPKMEVEPLFPPGTAFGRLTHLEVIDREREHPPPAGVVGLWELMASGGLPALAKRSVRLDEKWGVENVRNRVVPAFEAVAGSLTHLHLEEYRGYGEWPSVEVDVGYELGVAVGKLWRLQDLALRLSEDGRVYHAVAQGVAASGGGNPLPLLWRVMVLSEVKASVDLVASLLLPSVRVFSTYHFDVKQALVTACAVRQAGYKHFWAMGCILRSEREDRRREIRDSSQPIAPGCCCRLVGSHLDIAVPSWVISLEGQLPPLDDDEP